MDGLMWQCDDEDEDVFRSMSKIMEMFMAS